jgi:hypothetical protein
MRQKTLIFKKQFERRTVIWALPDSSWKLDAAIPEIELKRSAIRAGYIVKNVRSFPVIITMCDAAKANWPKKEREKGQKEIDAMPQQTILLKNPLIK